VRRIEAMKNIVVIALLVLAAWYGYEQYQRRPEVAGLEETAQPLPSALGGAVSGITTSSGNPFKCDGRIYCSQMTSCAEATYFLRNCPGTKMDGDHDGVPCESQWCGR
jgi:excalibur calcium-binding domain-containing protein